MKNKILVTGGVGYIGSHTVVALIDQGYEVAIIDNLSNSQIEMLDGVEQITGKRPVFEQIDLIEKEKVYSFFNKHSDIKSIIHFAASKAVGESVEQPLLYYYNNLVSLINLLEAMQKFSIPNFVFSSSCTVYGEPDILPVTEKTPVKKANSPYGNTKQICEEIIQDTIKAFRNISAISLRYFNPIGAHHSGLIGELPLGIPDNLLPFITQTAIGVREQLKIFGNNYNTPDGTCIRDYIYVMDLAKAHIVAIERLINERNKEKFEVFNLGTGNGVSVMEMVKIFEKVSGVNLNYKIVERRAGDVEKVWSDTKFANEELGWKAETSLEDTVLSAWRWEQNYRNKK